MLQFRLQFGTSEKIFTMNFITVYWKFIKIPLGFARIGKIRLRIIRASPL
jgi:hypothetical protein